MVYRIGFHHTTIRAISEGEGIPLVLLHGYLESLNIWDNFITGLLPQFRVIRMDLPGHGESGVVAPVHTMEIMTESVITVLDALSVESCFLVGHSMGGYVTLAVAEASIGKLLGFCLFHSTPFADTDDKKANRDREIELIRSGKKELIIQTNISKGFADDNLEKFKTEVERARQIALGTPDDGIIAALQGMKQRTDRSVILQQSSVPVLWILGQKDNYIIFNIIKRKINLNRKGRLLVLKNSGHMGFIEESQNASKGIISFFYPTG
jgi:pimeloyl-ACP methyl ester carboxylesterase